jgi:hypothetical protein
MNRLHLKYPSLRDSILGTALADSQGNIPLASRLVNLRSQVGPSRTSLCNASNCIEDSLNYQETRHQQKGDLSGENEGTLESLSKRRGLPVLNLRQPTRNIDSEGNSSADTLATVAPNDLSLTMVEWCARFLVYLMQVHAVLMISPYQ